MSEVSDELPPSWAWKTVAEIGDVGLGRQRSPNNHAGPHMRRYVRAANITWNGWDLSDVKEMNFNPADFHRFQLRVGDVLLNEGSGSAKEVGKPAIWRGEIEDCCFQNTLVRVQPIGCSSEYLYYYFRWLALSGGVAPETQGVNIHHIGRAGVANCRLPVAPLAEQCRIVARIEALFARTRRARADLQRIAPLGQSYRAQVLEHHYSSAAEQDTMRGVPENTLASLAGFDGLTSDGDWIESKDQDPSGGVRLIQLADVGDGEFLDKSRRYVTAATVSRLRCTLLKAGDVLIARMPDPLGRACIFPVLDQPAITAVDVFIWRGGRSSAHPAWIVMALNSPSLRHEIACLAGGTTRQRISGGNLKRLKLLTPPEAVQKSSAAEAERSRLASKDIELAAARAITLLDRLEQSILARAFRGELVPQDSAEAPASVMTIDAPRPARARHSRAA